MLVDSQRREDRLLSICATMRGLVDDSIRDGMARAVPDPIEATQLSNVYLRLQQRIRSIEHALREFGGDLNRIDRVFERADYRVNGPAFLLDEVEQPAPVAS